MNFNVFDFRDQFDLHEVVCLCLGRNPSLPVPTRGDPDAVGYDTLWKAAHQATEGAIMACARAHIAGKTRASLPKATGLLYPEWALFFVRENDTTTPSGKIISLEQWVHGLKPSYLAESKFSRKSVAEWLAQRSFVPAYDFGRPGGEYLQPSNSGDAQRSGSEERRWPWGRHETKLLIELEAAAREFWSTFDPDNPRTAPKNEVVSAWLQQRGVGKAMADKMATLLRADGLPNGPRTSH